MKSKRRSCYGVLLLSSATVRGLDREWSVVERPRPAAPALLEVTASLASVLLRRSEKRPLAA
jgi:hypothetical protein